MDQVDFKPWPKIYRQSANIIVTEKIDGTNSCIIIKDGEIIGCQSRKRLITPEEDNHGFATWVKDNSEKLLSLGDGYHYGEWAGPGIQKNPHRLNEKRFFLFNTKRWGEHNPNTPDICDVVPVLYEGPGNISIDNIMLDLHEESINKGYIAEGVVVFTPSSGTMVKYTFNNPDGKWTNDEK